MYDLKDMSLGEYKNRNQSSNYNGIGIIIMMFYIH